MLVVDLKAELLHILISKLIRLKAHLKVFFFFKKKKKYSLKVIKRDDIMTRSHCFEILVFFPSAFPTAGPSSCPMRSHPRPKATKRFGRSKCRVALSTRRRFARWFCRATGWVGVTRDRVFCGIFQSEAWSK